MRPSVCRRRRPPLLLVMLAAAGVVGGLAAPLLAQPTATGAVQLAPVTGRDFAGMRLPGEVQVTNLTFAAARAWAWVDDDPNTPNVLGRGAGIGTVQRLLLQGDVRIELGGHRFTAAQASVWIQHLSDPADAAPAAAPEPGADVGAAVRTRQIAIYFDRVSDPGADVGFAQAGDRLLVTGVVRGELGLRHDSLRRGRPAVLAGTRAEDPVRVASAFAAEGEARLARHMRRLLGMEDPEGAASVRAGRAERADAAAAGAGADVYGPLKPFRPGLSRVYEPDSPLATGLLEEIRRVGTPAPEGLPPVDRIEPLFAENGIITFAAGNDRMLTPGVGADPGERALVRLVPGVDGADNSVVMDGGVVVQYSDIRKNRSLQISAERAVVFLQPGPVSNLSSFGADAVKGIYLEGDVVAGDGRYTIRGPRVYYDIQNQQAVMVDAVFWTYDQQRGLPLYVRAAEIRQLAANQWQASKARLATTSFFDPVFSLGAKSVTITRKTEVGATAGARAGGGGEGEQDGRGNVSIAGGVATGTTGGRDGAGGREAQIAEFESNYIDARGITVRAADIPVFFLPRLRGEIDDIPLTDLRVENSSRSGTAIKTAWNIFSVMGAEPPRGLSIDALLDLYFDRGPGLGVKSRWRRPGAEVGDDEGNLLAYTLPIDFGEDVLSSGLRRGRDHEFRGMLLGDYSLRLDERWWLQLEVGQISDENFVDAFFKTIAQEGREITNSAYLKRADDNTLLTFIAKGEFNDFTPNQYLLQSQGYNVDKLPEAAYSRLADDLLWQSAPGALVWSHEYRVGRIALNFTEPTATELGFDTPARARAAFGFDDPNLSPADQLRAAGYTEQSVLRADTRQELTGVFEYGVFKISPFLTGRFTAYDTEFEDFRPAGSNNADEQFRYWYSAGVRTSTQITRVNNAINSSVLDLYRTRHIIEPSMTLWYAGANLGQEQLPTYDERVESLATGTAGNFNIAQTWQTQRGGPGRWRSVDVLKINTGVTGSTDDADQESPIERFFVYRPEYSQLGNFLNMDVAWQATDAVGLTFDTIYDMDSHQPARTSAGGVIQHSPDFSSYAEARYINALDATYVNFGFDFKLTRRYTFGVTTSYDVDEDDFQSYNFRLRRRVPEATVGLNIGYNNITSETSLSVVFEPAGSADLQRNEVAQRLRDIGR